MANNNSHHTVDLPVFEAVLYPHRSLSRLGFRWLMVTMGAASTLLSVPFHALGAWPVIGFFGLDMALLYLFFQCSYRDAKRKERISLTHLELMVRRIDPRGRLSEWRFNPIWVRLSREEDSDFGLHRLAVMHKDQALEIAH